MSAEQQDRGQHDPRDYSRRTLLTTRS